MLKGWQVPASPVSVDQAAGLRRMVSPDGVRVIAVTGGKGGVGKTNVSVNLALAMSALGREVLLMDADLGLGNVDVLLGLRPKHNLSHVINGEATLDEVAIETSGGIKVIPAASGVRRMAELGAAETAGLIHAFSEFGYGAEVLIVDTAAGIAENVLNFSKASQEIVVVVCDEPASITDAYAMIKTLHRDHGRHRFRVVANMTRSASEGKALFIKLLNVTDRFLDVSLDYMGAIPFDEYLRKAIQRQRAVIEAYPRSQAALAFKKLAVVADNWPVPTEASGQLEFFVERLIQVSQRGRDARP